MAMADETTRWASQRAIWNDVVGEAWVRYAAVHDEMAAPFGTRVMDALGDLGGARVLDVGCGTGATCAQLVERGASEVLGVDLSEPMIGAARRGAGPEVDFVVDDVTALEVSDRFDVVFSRFGVMFFPDPRAAFERLRALATPTARFGFCSWGPPMDNPMMTLAVMASIPVLGPPHLPAPGEPGPFSLSTAETIEELLTSAGWTDVEMGELDLDQPHPAGDAEAVAEMALDFNPMLVQAVHGDITRRDAAHAAIVEALRPFERDGVVHLRSSARIVTAAGGGRSS